MDEPEERGVLEVDVTHRRQLRTMIEFVQGIHHHIDPDRFEIDEERLRAVFERLDGEHPDTIRIAVTYRDLLFLETLIDAAGTYSARRDYPDLDGVSDEDLDDLLAWVGRAQNALFRRPPTIH